MVKCEEPIEVLSGRTTKTNIKRLRESDSGLHRNGNDSKRRRIDHKKPNFSSSRKVKIIDLSHPRLEIAHCRVKELESLIHVMIGDWGRLSTINPKFKWSGYFKGTFNVECENLETLLFLKHCIDVMPAPWEGAFLKVVESDFKLPQSEASVWLADSKITPEAVLHRIQVQNSNLKTNKWKLLNRQIDDAQGQILMWKVDTQSQKILEKSLGKVFYGLGKIQFYFWEQQEDWSRPQYYSDRIEYWNMNKSSVKRKRATSRYANNSRMENKNDRLRLIKKEPKFQ